MSKRRVTRRPSTPASCPALSPRADEADTIALRIHQSAATAGVIAEGQAREAEPLPHALYLIEEPLLDVAERVERLRRVPR